MAKGDEKVLILLHGEIKTPPMSREARLEVGFLLRSCLEIPFKSPKATNIIAYGETIGLNK